MDRQDAIQITFIGLALLAISLILSDELGEMAVAGSDFFYDGWFRAASALLTLFGAYHWVTKRRA